MTRAAELVKGDEAQRLDAALAIAEQDLAELRDAGLIGVDEPELAAADAEQKQAGLLERAYQAGAACLTRSA